MIKILRGSLGRIEDFYYQYPEGVYRPFEYTETSASGQNLEYCQSNEGDTSYYWSSYSESLAFNSEASLRVHLGEGASEYIER